jgi:hypothetical protein
MYQNITELIENEKFAAPKIVQSNEYNIETEFSFSSLLPVPIFGLNQKEFIELGMPVILAPGRLRPLWTIMSLRPAWLQSSFKASMGSAVRPCLKGEKRIQLIQGKSENIKVEATSRAFLERKEKLNNPNPTYSDENIESLLSII